MMIVDVKMCVNKSIDVCRHSTPESSFIPPSLSSVTAIINTVGARLTLLHPRRGPKVQVLVLVVVPSVDARSSSRTVLIVPSRP